MSNINPNNIDGTFPIAGQDNSSQGFRDNFTNIRNNFSYAESEISDLQNKAITTSALTGSTLSNDMDYNQLYRAKLFSPSYTFYELGSLAGTAYTFNFLNGNFQHLTATGSYNVQFSNWPPSSALSYQIGVGTLWISVPSSLPAYNYTLTFDTTSLSTGGILYGMNDIAGAALNSPIAGKATITFDTAGEYFLQFMTTDGGQTFSIKDISRNYSTLRDPNFYWNDAVTPTLLVGYGATQTEFQTILGYETGQDTVSAKGSYNSVAVGNLSLANVNYPYIDTGVMSGYSLSTLRGNLQTASLTPVQSNDFLGYFNAITYTGIPAATANVFQQVSSIAFYATGSNPVTGLGGNVAIFTHKPNTTSNTMVQAVGIENDQSVKMFGNVTIAGNLSIAGTITQSAYQFLAAPSTNFWANITPGTQRLIIAPTTTLALGNVTLPNTTVDGTIVSIHSANATITSFGANTLQSGTVMKSTVAYTLAAGTGVDYWYHSSENAWYKIR